MRVTNDGKAVVTEGATGTLALLDGDQPTELTLKPAGPGAMTAKSKTAMPKEARAGIAITLADKTTLAAAK